MEHNQRRQDAGGSPDSSDSLRVLDDGSSKPPVHVFDSAHLALELDLSIYSVDAILRAAYKFTDRCFILLQPDETREDRCVVFLAGKTSSSELGTVLGEFTNELLDQQLRERLEAQFGAIRTLVVAQAFAEGNLLDRDRDEGNYLADPQGIGRAR